MKTQVATARIRLAASGRLVGGGVLETHPDGEVTILWAGLRKRGYPIPDSALLRIERGEVSQ